MKRYKLVVENPLDSFILDTEENVIVTLCNTKRPDLQFDKLEVLIEKANKYEMQRKKQKFQLGDVAYMIDADYGFYECEVYRIDLIDGKYIYTCETDFDDDDIGDWVFTSEIERELYLEAMFNSQK